MADRNLERGFCSARSRKRRRRHAVKQWRQRGADREGLVASSTEGRAVFRNVSLGAPISDASVSQSILPSFSHASPPPLHLAGKSKMSRPGPEQLPPTSVRHAVG